MAFTRYDHEPPPRRPKTKPYLHSTRPRPPNIVRQAVPVPSRMEKSETGKAKPQNYTRREQDSEGFYFIFLPQIHGRINLIGNRARVLHATHLDRRLRHRFRFIGWMGSTKRKSPGVDRSPSVIPPPGFREQMLMKLKIKFYHLSEPGDAGAAVAASGDYALLYFVLLLGVW